jgi:putative endonuclease
MARFLYVYVPRSQRDGQFYVGFTGDLKQRLAQHNAGRVESTRGRAPLELIYYEACRDQRDATSRERYLKSAWGKRYLKGRLRNYLTG